MTSKGLSKAMAAPDSHSPTCDHSPTIRPSPDFVALRRKDLTLIYRQFQLLRPEPIFIDIYQPAPFPTLARFKDFFRPAKRPMWVLGPLAAPSAYLVFHDFQRQHDLANLDFMFFDCYPAPGSAAARGFWDFVRARLAEHRLTRVQSFTLAISGEKQRLLESFGFRQEGLLRQHYFHNGRLHDVVVQAWMAEGRDV